MLVLAAALLTATTAPAFAGKFDCEGVVSDTLVCGDVMASAVTVKFTKKYPAPKYKLYVASGFGLQADGNYSGTAAVWLGSTSSQAPDAASYTAIHFTGQGTRSEAREHEKDALKTATEHLMRALGVGVPAAPQAQVRQARAPQCRTVQVTEQTLQSDYVCDYNNLGPTNCRTENKSVPRTVDKQVCTN